MDELVSVVIPVYNGKDYIAEAIESVLGQTYKNIEIIVVNDGSTDSGATEKSIEPYMDRIHYIKKENGGVASALNIGIKAMRGEYFAWLSHDDLFDEKKVEIQMKAIVNSKNKESISITNYRFFDNETGIYVDTDFEKYYSLKQIESSLFLLLWTELHFSSLLFHKNHFDRIGLFDESIKTAQDNEFMYRLLKGQKLIFDNIIGSFVRLHNMSGTTQMKDIVNIENLELYKKILTELSDKELQEISGSKNNTLIKIQSIINSLTPKENENFKTIKGKSSNYVLVGAGVYGKRINYELRNHGIIPKLFLDNDVNKDGKIIDGTLCKKLEKSNIPFDSKIIITNKFYKGLEKQLKDYGIKTSLIKSEIDSMLLKIT